MTYLLMIATGADRPFKRWDMRESFLPDRSTAVHELIQGISDGFLPDRSPVPWWQVLEVCRVRWGRNTQQLWCGGRPTVFGGLRGEHSDISLSLDDNVHYAHLIIMFNTLTWWYCSVCSLYDNVQYAHFHGTEDQLIKYDGQDPGPALLSNAKVIAAQL